MAEEEMMTYRDALRRAIREEMQADESVFLIGEDIGSLCRHPGIMGGIR
jgi:pyruvate/2-oxoglutarate/acetoin dehydrogenase E1 component